MNTSSCMIRLWKLNTEPFRRGKMEKTQKPFGMADKLGYMFGDFGNDFTFILSAMFMMKFYTDVMGVSAAVVGLVMMCARFVDAFTDVTMGQIADRSRPTAKGKFAPWIRRMMGPVALASFLLYASWFKDMPLMFKTVYMAVTYLLWGSICYTAINIPYGSMASAISPEAKDRAELSKWRGIGATFAATAIGVILPMVVYYKDASGHAVLSSGRMSGAALVCSVCALICYIFCYHLTTERVRVPQKTEKFDLYALLKQLIRNRSLIGIVVCALILLIGQLSFGNVATYLFPNYFGNPAGQSMATMLQTVITLLLATFATVQLSERFGKKELCIGTCFISAAALIIAYFMHIRNMTLFLVFYGLGYLAIAVFSLVCWAMITDVIDDTEIRTGERSDGTIYSVYSFARKMGQAASAGVVGSLLSSIGYSKATAFDPAVVSGLYSISCLVPAACFLVFAAAAHFLYPLDKNTVLANVEKLKEGK